MFAPAGPTQTQNCRYLKPPQLYNEWTENTGSTPLLWPRHATYPCGSKLKPNPKPGKDGRGVDPRLQRVHDRAEENALILKRQRAMEASARSRRLRSEAMERSKSLKESQAERTKPICQIGATTKDRRLRYWGSMTALYETSSPWPATTDKKCPCLFCCWPPLPNS